VQLSDERTFFVNQRVRTKYYQIIDGNVISTTIVGKTSVLSTTAADWNKYYHLPRTG
jgi:hypothetical protein